jgi:hypothetical protein
MSDIMSISEACDMRDEALAEEREAIVRYAWTEAAEWHAHSRSDIAAAIEALAQDYERGEHLRPPDQGHSP